MHTSDGYLYTVKFRVTAESRQAAVTAVAAHVTQFVLYQDPAYGCMSLTTEPQRDTYVVVLQLVTQTRDVRELIGFNGIVEQLVMTAPWQAYVSQHECQYQLQPFLAKEA